MRTDAQCRCHTNAVQVARRSGRCGIAVASVARLHAVAVAALAINAGSSTAKILAMAASACRGVVSQAAKRETVEPGCIAGIHPSFLVHSVRFGRQSAADCPILQLLKIVLGHPGVTRSLAACCCEHCRVRVSSHNTKCAIITTRYCRQIAIDGISTTRNLIGVAGMAIAGQDCCRSLLIGRPARLADLALPGIGTSPPRRRGGQGHQSPDLSHSLLPLHAPRIFKIQGPINPATGHSPTTHILHPTRWLQDESAITSSPSQVTRQTHRVGVDLVATVPHRPTGRVRIAADPTDPVAADAIGAPTLVMTRGTARYVAACSSTVEVCRAAKAPSHRVRVLRIGAGGSKVLPSVTISAEACAVATLTQGLVCSRLDRVPAQVVAAVNEVPIHAIGE